LDIDGASKIKLEKGHHALEIPVSKLTKTNDAGRLVLHARVHCISTEPFEGAKERDTKNMKQWHLGVQTRRESSFAQKMRLQCLQLLHSLKNRGTMPAQEQPPMPNLPRPA